jgi:hypothetical protein
MDNYYIIITKWTKKNQDSPGYINGFLLSEILKSNNLSEDLLQHKILPQYFNYDVFFTWANITNEISRLGQIDAFTSVKSPDESISYSLVIYKNKDVQTKLEADNFELFSNLKTCKKEYSDLLDLSTEVKSGEYSLSIEDFYKISLNEKSFQEIENIFNSL